MVDQRPGTANGEGQCHHRPATLDGAFDHSAECLDGISRFVAPVAVGGLDHHVVRFRHGLGIVHHGIVAAAQVAENMMRRPARNDLRFVDAPGCPAPWNSRSGLPGSATDLCGGTGNEGLQGTLGPSAHRTAVQGGVVPGDSLRLAVSASFPECKAVLQVNPHGSAGVVRRCFLRTHLASLGR